MGLFLVLPGKQVSTYAFRVDEEATVKCDKLYQNKVQYSYGCNSPFLKLLHEPNITAGKRKRKL